MVQNWVKVLKAGLVVIKIMFSHFLHFLSFSFFFSSCKNTAAAHSNTVQDQFMQVFGLATFFRHTNKLNVAKQK